MWFYIQTWFPLLTIALTAAICFSVASFIMGQTRPQAWVHRIHAKQIDSRLLVWKGAPVFSALSNRFERTRRTWSPRQCVHGQGSWTRYKTSEACQRQLHCLFPRKCETLWTAAFWPHRLFSCLNREPPPSSWKWEICRAGRSSPVSRVSRLHMLPREKIEAEIAYLEIVGRKDGRQRHCSDLA